MTISAKVIEDSISYAGVRLTTLELRYPRFIHAEFMTHRTFSRNASSSRAIPVLKMLKSIWSDMAMPIHWGANMPGMQAKEELTGWRRKAAICLWTLSGWGVCLFAYLMTKIGLHKQIANRITEPWSHITVLVSATDWTNFFALRRHPDAQPEIRDLADKMLAAMEMSHPTLRKKGEYHLPYLSNFERETMSEMDAISCSIARCARVSYLLHNGAHPSRKADIALAERLIGSDPKHASPTEHQATPSQFVAVRSGNFRGWNQHRKTIKNESAKEV